MSLSCGLLSVVWALLFGAQPGVALSSLLCGLGAAQAQTSLSLSGTVQAVAGSTLERTVVFACFESRPGAGCDPANSKAVKLEGGGQKAAFKLEGLADRTYTVIAWRDLNSDGVVDEQGDQIGVYSLDGQNPTPVKPPQFGLTLQMQVSSRAPTAPATSANAASSLLGTWEDVGSSDAGTLELKADGTYTESNRASFDFRAGCRTPAGFESAYVFRYATGRYTVQGNTLTQTDNSIGTYRRMEGCKITQEAFNPSSKTYLWRVSENNGRLRLWLTKPGEKEAQSPRYSRKP